MINMLPYSVYYVWVCFSLFHLNIWWYRGHRLGCQRLLLLPPVLGGDGSQELAVHRVLPEDVLQVVNVGFQLENLRLDRLDVFVLLPGYLGLLLCPDSEIATVCF